MFQTRLVQLRKKHGITQKQLAKSLSLSELAIQNYESGRRKPAYDALISLADYFGVSLDYLVGRADTPTPVPQTAQSAETEIQSEFNKLTESEQKDVLDYIRFKKHRRPEAK